MHHIPLPNRARPFTHHGFIAAVYAGMATLKQISEPVFLFVQLGSFGYRVTCETHRQADDLSLSNFQDLGKFNAALQLLIRWHKTKAI